MPTYEYRCTKGHSFEVIQRINDPPLTKCEVCGRPVERVMHSPAVHFKGSGFYHTDYGTQKSQREKSSAESSSSDSSSTTSTDSKPAKSEGTSSGESKSTTDKAKPKPSSD